MKYDKPLVAALLGCLSTISAEIVTRIFLAFGIGKYSVYEMDSFFITINRPNPIIGFIVSSTIGGLIAILFYYSLEKIGQDYLVIKCALVNIFAWVVLEVISMAIIETRFIGIRPISDYYVHMAGTVVYGITLGILIKKFLIHKPASDKR